MFSRSNVTDAGDPHQRSLLLTAETETMDEALPEEVLLDENAESEKHSFFMTGGALRLQVPQQSRSAYSLAVKLGAGFLHSSSSSTTSAASSEAAKRSKDN